MVVPGGEELAVGAVLVVENGVFVDVIALVGLEDCVVALEVLMPVVEEVKVDVVEKLVVE